MQLAEIVDHHVPPPPRRRRTQLSVGQYLVIAAIKRAVDVRSKRALYRDWYQGSMLSRLLPATEAELSSRRFWDHMDAVEPEHLEAIQGNLLGRLEELFGLADRALLYDTTNFHSFIDTFNERCELAQRGDDKQSARTYARWAWLCSRTNTRACRSITRATPATSRTRGSFPPPGASSCAPGWAPSSARSSS